MRRKYFWLMLLIILILASPARAASGKYVSEYGAINEFDWRILSGDSKFVRFDSPQEFLTEVDYYVSEISKYLNKSDWLKNYDTREKILFKATTYGRCHVAGGYKNVDDPQLKIYLKNKMFRYNCAPLAHEITHLIALNYSSLSLREGLADLMQEKYGKNPANFNYGAPIYSVSKQFTTDKYKDVLNSIGRGGIPDNIDVYKQDRISFYILSYSFSKYLVNSYGIRKFMSVYKTNDLFATYKKVYGKSLKQLKAEWLNFLEKRESYRYTYKEWQKKFFEKHKE